MTGIVPFTYFGGLHYAVGSTFLRAEGIVANTPEFEIWKHGHKYESLIFQKVYWIDMMKRFDGPKILDLCDPDWINTGTNLVEAGSRADAITCSSSSLTDLVRKYFPGKLIYHVPDRLNFKSFPSPKKDQPEKVENVVWYGFIHNAHEMLSHFGAAIKKLKLKLTVISDKPYSKQDIIQELKPAFIQYDKNTIYATLQQYDMILNPASGRAVYKYKSNNKSIIGWKLGVPVAETENELERLLDLNEREKEVHAKHKLVLDEYNVLQSIEQYKEIIDKIKKNGI
jgi:hypothetical protein